MTATTPTTADRLGVHALQVAKATASKLGYACLMVVWFASQTSTIMRLWSAISATLGSRTGAARGLVRLYTLLYKGHWDATTHFVRRAGGQGWSVDEVTYCVDQSIFTRAPLTSRTARSFSGVSSANKVEKMAEVCNLVCKAYDA